MPLHLPSRFAVPLLLATLLGPPGPLLAAPAAKAPPAPAGAATGAKARHLAALQALWKRDFAWAQALWRSMADAGDSEALVELGHLARRGDGRPKDAAEARQLYEAALAKGHPDGEAGLGRLAETAEKPDLAEAVRRYRAAAARGSAWAKYYLGLMHRHGEGLPVDLPLSLKWLREAAAQGHLEAEHEAASALLRGIGVTADVPAARGVLQRLAGLGHPASQRELAFALLQESPAQALPWMQRAADGADPIARGFLAAAHYNGEHGLPRDAVRAAQLARGAAEDDEATAQMLMAVMTANGEGGLARDGAQVVHWLRRAANNGHARAAWELARVFTEGHHGEKPACEPALAAARQSAAAGDPDGERLLDELENGACAHIARWALFRRAEAREAKWPVPLDKQPVTALAPEAAKAEAAAVAAELQALERQGVLAARCARVRADAIDLVTHTPNRPADGSPVLARARALAEAMRAGAREGSLMCARALVWNGRTQFVFGDFIENDEVARTAREMAERGDSFGMEQLGAFHGEGLGVPQDFQLGWMWHQLARARQQSEEDAGTHLLARLTPRQREQVTQRLDAFVAQQPGWLRQAPVRAGQPRPPAVAALSAPFPLFDGRGAPPPPLPQAAAEPARRDAPQLRLATSGHTAAITAMATDAQGRWLVTASADKTVAVWALPQGQREAVLRLPLGPGDEGRLRAVALSDDGRFVAAGGDTGLAWPGSGHAAYVIERESGRVLQRLAGAAAPVTQLLWLDEGRLLALGTAGPVGELRLYRRADGRLLQRETACDGAVRSLVALPEGRLLVACADAQLQAWRLAPAEAQPLQRTERARAPGGALLSAVQRSPEGRTLAVAYCSQTRLDLLDARDLRPQHRVEDSFSIGGLDQTHCDHLAFTPDGASLVRGGSQREGLVWRIDHWAQQGRGPRQERPMGGEPITALLGVPGRGLAWATEGGAWGLLPQAAGAPMPPPQGARGTLLFSTNRYYGPARKPGEIHINGHVDSDVSDEENLRPRNADGSRTLTLRDRGTDLAHGLGLSHDGELVAFSARAPGGRRQRLVFDAAQQALAPQRAAQAPVAPLKADWVHTWRNSQGAPRHLVLGGQRMELPGDEAPESLAVSPDDGSAYVGTATRLLRLGRDGKTMWQAPVAATAFGVAAAPDGRWVVAALADGTVRWFAAASGRELAALFVHPDGQRWVMWTPEGPYVASPGAESLFGWHLNQGAAAQPRFVSSERLYDVFYRPDIVGAKLRGEPVEGLAGTTVAQALARPAPRVSLEMAKQGTADELARLCWRVADEGGGVGDVRVFHNGKLLRSRGVYRDKLPAPPKAGNVLTAQTGAALLRQLRSAAAPASAVAAAPAAPSTPSTPSAPADDCAEVPLLPGENTLAVAAFNADNSVQSPLVQQTVVSRRAAPKPRLHVLAIGINEFAEPAAKLEYAAKDARDIHALLQKAGLATGRFESIHAKLLTDRQADKPGIERALAELAKDARPWDSVVFFVASHGVMDGQRYHLVTAGFDGQLRPETLIDSRELLEWSKKIPALHQLLILDTCHAGGVDWMVRGLYDARLSVLARQMGLHVFASASDRQLALDGFEGNGLFTHTLLGVAGRGSASGVNAWGLQAREDTARIAAKLKHAQTPLIISFGRDFQLLRAAP